SIEEAARTLVLQMLRDGIEAGPMLRLAGGDPTQVSARIVAQAAAEGDGLASSILARAARGVGEALAQAVTLLAPRRIILGGGVSLIGEDGWFAPIRHYLDRLVFPPFRDTFDLVPAALGEEVVVHGALALAREAAATPQ
ncbi:MAG: ROK family protein, partial [Isosphaeraceae bacterium]|nr:ROK family protein [Isosphaeraceae bacterium]